MFNVEFTAARLSLSGPSQAFDPGGPTQLPVSQPPALPPLRTLDTIQKRSRNAPSHWQCITPNVAPPPTTELTVETTESHSCIGPSISSPSPTQCRLRAEISISSKSSPPAGAMAAFTLAYRFPISPCRLFNSPLAAQLALGKRSGPLPGRAAVALLSHSGRTRPPLPRGTLHCPFFCVAFPDVATILAPRSLPRAVVFRRWRRRRRRPPSCTGPDLAPTVSSRSLVSVSSLVVAGFGNGLHTSPQISSGLASLSSTAEPNQGPRARHFSLRLTSSQAG